MARVHSETQTPKHSEHHALAENTLYQQDVVSFKDLTLDQIHLILKTAAKLKSEPANQLLKNKIIAHCFFEPSSRTRLSFETATLRLGGHVIGFASDDNISTQKGETLNDTIRVISSYADLIVIRHPKEGSARFAAEVSPIPVINAGDGANQHPTQTLVDLFTIQECFGRLEGLSMALVGDLKYGRTIHSLAQACMLLDIRLFLVAPESLSLPEYIADALKQKGVRFSFHRSLEEIVPKVDIIYMTRIQKERFNGNDYQTMRNQFVIVPETLVNAKPDLKILHPLPRVNEIHPSIDKTPYAHYFQQSANGVFIREALLTLLLNKALP